MSQNLNQSSHIKPASSKGAKKTIAGTVQTHADEIASSKQSQKVVKDQADAADGNQFELEKDSQQNTQDEDVVNQPDDDDMITAAPQDYTDGATIGSKTANIQEYNSGTAGSMVTIDPQAQAKLVKTENKLKRLADLGDINASKQTQIYLDALGDVAQANP